MDNSQINFKSPRVLIGIFLGLAALVLISFVFRPSFLTVFFCIWIASNVAKINEPKQVAQIGGGIGAFSGIYFVFIGEFSITNGNSFWEVLANVFVGAVLFGFFYAFIGYWGAKLLKKYEQGQGPFF